MFCFQFFLYFFGDLEDLLLFVCWEDSLTISLLLSEWLLNYDTNANFYLLPSRAWELLAGSIASFIVYKKGIKKNNIFALLGISAIFISIFFF